MAKTSRHKAQKGDKSASLNTAHQTFELDNPTLDRDVRDGALVSGGYPYEQRLKNKLYEAQLYKLQIELTKLQASVRSNGERILVLFEGRDTAGKGGCISRFMQYLNPRHARVVALTKPTDTEQGQWYFQRYTTHLPTKGDIVLFDRSWYNRAGVERVMKFCTKDQLADFLREAPQFEGLLVRDGIKLFKVFLTIGQEMQLKRFHDRRHDPLKQWKLTDIDRQAIGMWDEYTAAKREMFRFTHTEQTPWTVVRANDKRRARLEVIRHVLLQVDYDGRDAKAIGKVDPQIIGHGPEFFYDSASDDA